MCVFYLLVCVGYRLRSLSHGGIEYRSHNGEISVMSRDSSKGNAPVTMVTSVPWERERDITVVAVLAAPQPTVFSIRFWCNCRGHRIYTVSSSSYLHALRQLASHLDWCEPIGLQERLKGRSSHNGEISVMSRSHSQGTEVTIVTGAFFACGLLINFCQWERVGTRTITI